MRIRVLSKTDIMENQMENKMETGIIMGYIGVDSRVI